MKNLQNMKVLVGIVILLILAGGVYLFTNRNSNQTTYWGQNTTSTETSTSTISSSTITTDTTKNTVTSSYASKCGLTVISPVIGSKITFPLTVKGIIDNSKANTLGCSWNNVLSRAGEAQVFYNLKNQGWVAPGVAVPIISSSGLTASTTVFSVGLNVYAKNLGLTSGTPIKITFTENKPVDGSKQNTFDMLVYLK